MAQSLGSILAEAAGAFSGEGSGDARPRPRRLVGLALDLALSEVWGHPECEISDRQARQVRRLIRRTLACEPLSRVLGRREFWGLDFALSADTLDPRPDSEAVVEAVLRRVPERNAPMRVLDLGTGSGCLLLALLSELPRSVGVGVDITAGAAATARMNAAALGLASRARFFVGEWGSAIKCQFTVVIANPPYIANRALGRLPHAVRDFDPRHALDGGADGLDAYRAIARGLLRLLAPNSIFVTEVGIGQAEAVVGMLACLGLAIDGVEQDFAGIARCVIGRPSDGSRPLGAVPKSCWNVRSCRLG
jgi:release factor glutamine methyltransferase